MDLDDFIAGYMERSGIAAYEKRGRAVIIAPGWDCLFVALPCACPEPGCPGWAMVTVDGDPALYGLLNQITFCGPEMATWKTPTPPGPPAAG